MRNFVTKTCQFLIGVFFSLLIIGFGGRYLNSTDSNFKIDEKISTIILGHSHSECAYNDEQIRNVKNYSMSGESYFYTYLKTQKILDANSHLKNVFIELSNNQVSKEMDDWIWGDYFISHFYPLYAPLMNKDEINFLLSKNRKAVINVQAKSVVKNFFYGITKKNYLNHLGGYLPLADDGGKSFRRNTSKKKELLPLQLSISNLNFLDSIITLCASQGLNVFLIRSPLHKDYPGLNNESAYKRIIKERYHNVDFLDFKDFSLSDHEFEDFEHLNETGSRAFSLFFNNLLEAGLLQMNSKQEFIDRNINAIKTRTNG